MYIVKFLTVNKTKEDPLGASTHGIRAQARMLEPLRPKKIKIKIF